MTEEYDACTEFLQLCKAATPAVRKTLLTHIHEFNAREDEMDDDEKEAAVARIMKILLVHFAH